jgi:hypothetical protein
MDWEHRISRKVWQLLFPTGAVSRAMMLPSVASMIIMLQSVFSIGFGPTLERALVWYNWLLDFFLGPIKQGIEHLAAEISIRLALQPHWKHVFVLFNVYMVRSVQNAFKQHRPTGVFRGLLGILIGLLVAVTCGALELQKGTAAQILVFAPIPVLGLFAYGTLNGIWQATVRYEVEKDRRLHIESRFQAFSGHVGAAARRTIIAFVIMGAALLIPYPPLVSSPAVFIVFLLVILHAFYNLWDGIDQVRREPQHGAYLDTPSARIGLDMLRYFLYSAILITLGAFDGPP